MKDLKSQGQLTFNINLQALEVFCEVVRQQSFSRAARKFEITQSAVSQIIAHLEGVLGSPLFDRSRRPLQLTRAGETYYEGCQDLLHDHRNLYDRIRQHHERWSGQVRVVAIYSVGLHSLNPYIRKFMASSPGATVDLEYLHPSEVYTAVLHDKADLGVVSYPSSHRHLTIHPWLEETMVLACPPSHRLASRSSIRIRDLHGEKFVAFRSDLRIRSEIDRVLKTGGTQVQIVSEFDNIETIKQALEVSEAVSILPHPTIQREVERGTLLQASLEDIHLVRPVGIISKRRRHLSQTVQEFLETLRSSTSS